MTTIPYSSRSGWRAHARRRGHSWPRGASAAASINPISTTGTMWANLTPRNSLISSMKIHWLSSPATKTPPSALPADTAHSRRTLPSTTRAPGAIGGRGDAPGGGRIPIRESVGNASAASSARSWLQSVTWCRMTTAAVTTPPARTPAPRTRGGTGRPRIAAVSPTATAPAASAPRAMSPYSHGRIATFGRGAAFPIRYPPCSRAALIDRT